MPTATSNKQTAVKYMAKGYHAVTPYLIIKGAAAAIDFYKKAFEATEAFRMADPSGKVGHAEIKIGDSMICWRMNIQRWGT